MSQYDWDNEELLELLSKLVALGELRLDSIVPQN